jgi:CelD/BcsL family acetyltransferase involved in cellulose biosynthesis
MVDLLAPFPNRTVLRDVSALVDGLGFGDAAGMTQAKGLVARRIDLADYVSMQAAFDDLAGRADDPNPFMSPALVAAAASGVASDQIVILAAFDDADPGRWLGVWCLRRARDLWSAGCEVLQAPILPRYECLAAPVLDAACAAAALASMLDLVRSSGTLPSLIRAATWPRALDRLMPAGWRASPAETWERAILKPVAVQAADAYLRQSMGKALNKRNNRQKQLAETGVLAMSSLRGAEAPAAFEHYIRLEAKGWKGQSGTSLAQTPSDAAYMRAAIARLADANRVSIDMVTLDGKPVAVGVVIEAAGHNLFWKAAFDEDHARFAPGSLLHLAVTRRLFAEARATLDSGMTEFTTPAHLPWSEREAMARVTIAHGAGFGAMAVRLGSALRHAMRRLKHLSATG